MKKYFAALLCLLASLGLVVPAGAVSLNSPDDLAANSDSSVLTGYALRPGTYMVDSAINISGQSRADLLVGNGVDLTVRHHGSGDQTPWFRLGQLTINNGTFTAEGSFGPNSWLSGRRAVVAAGVSQIGGLASLTGGSQGQANKIGYAYGLETANYSLSGGGRVEATGGDYGYNYGLYVTGLLTLEDGEVYAAGGTGPNPLVVGLRANGVVQNGGLMEARANAWQMGLLAGSGGYELNAGRFIAYGTTGSAVTTDYNSVHGAQGYDFTQKGGRVEAYGGDTTYSYGLNIQNNYTFRAGEILAVGGSGERADGLAPIRFTMSGGLVTARGGDGQYATGFSPYYYTQSGGRLEAYGGTGSGGNTERYGAYISNLTLTGGEILAVGGDGDVGGDFNVGLLISNVRAPTDLPYDLTAVVDDPDFDLSADYTNLPRQTRAGLGDGFARIASGTIIARGGTGDATNYGIYLFRNMEVAGTLQLERQDEAASIFSYSGYNGRITLLNGSTLVPVVDVAKADIDPGLASGLIISGDGSGGPGALTIQAGAMLRPRFINTTRLLKGAGSTVDIPFIDTIGGQIDGEFQNGGYFLAYTAEKTNTGRYVLRVERRANVEDAIPDIPCDNSRRILSLFGGALNPGVDDPVSRAWSAYDSSHSQAE